MRQVGSTEHCFARDHPAEIRARQPRPGEDCAGYVGALPHRIREIGALSHGAASFSFAKGTADEVRFLEASIQQRGLVEDRPARGDLVQLRVVEAGSPERCRGEHRAREIGFRQNGVFGEAAAEGGAGEVCSFRPYVVEPGFGEIRTRQGGALEARAREDRARLIRADVRSSSLAGATFLFADLSHAQLDQSILVGGTLAHANLHRTSREGANLTNTDLRGSRATDLDRARAEDFRRPT